MYMGQPPVGRLLPSQVELSNTIRRLWVDSNRWIRAFIISIIFNLGNREAIEARLGQIADAFAGLFTQYYSQQVGDRVRENYLRYVQNLELMTEAYRDNNLEAVAEQRKVLYGIADELAQEYSRINRYWDMATMQILLHELVDATERQIMSITAGDFVSDIEANDKFMEQAYRLADELTYGMLRQFWI